MSKNNNAHPAESANCPVGGEDGVIQDDRDAVARAMCSKARNVQIEKLASAIRRGENDGNTWVQAMRRHRLTYTPKALPPAGAGDVGYARGVEDAAKVADIPPDVAELVARIGEAEWGATDPFDADGHAAHVAESVRITAETHGQTEPQRMHGLYIKGTDTVICHTGTSPNSPAIARALAGAWNHLRALSARKDAQ